MGVSVNASTLERYRALSIAFKAASLVRALSLRAKFPVTTCHSHRGGGKINSFPRISLKS